VALQVYHLHRKDQIGRSVVEAWPYICCRYLPDILVPSIQFEPGLRVALLQVEAEQSPGRRYWSVACTSPKPVLQVSCLYDHINGYTAL